jgi:DNA-directed RNA polymerase subunit RPC12/RpoP
MKNEDGFTSFACKSCGTEIEASLDMIGEETECPACGAKITIPDNNTDDDGVLRFGPNDNSLANTQAMKSKTIRIELTDL